MKGRTGEVVERAGVAAAAEVADAAAGVVGTAAAAVAVAGRPWFELPPLAAGA